MLGRKPHGVNALSGRDQPSTERFPAVFGGMMILELIHDHRADPIKLRTRQTILRYFNRKNRPRQTVCNKPSGDKPSGDKPPALFDSTKSPSDI
jgi:hypothetical protein